MHLLALGGVVLVVAIFIVRAMTRARPAPEEQVPAETTPIGQEPPRLERRSPGVSGATPAAGAVAVAAPPALRAPAGPAALTQPSPSVRAHPPTPSAPRPPRDATPALRAHAPPPELERVTALARQGEMIEAIKLLRQQTDLGLADAKATAEALRDGRPLPSVAQALVGAPVEDAAAPPAPSHPAGQKQLELLQNLVRDGRLIEAIKLLRTFTELGLKDAKEAVEALRDTGALPARVHAQVAGTPAVAEAPGSAELATPATPQVDLERIRTLATSGELIPAIKLVREQTGLGLKDAKEAVEALRDGKPLTQAAYDALHGAALVER